MNYAHNNKQLKTVQHNIEQIGNTISKIKAKLTASTQEVELVPKTPALPRKVN